MGKDPACAPLNAAGVGPCGVLRQDNTGALTRLLSKNKTRVRAGRHLRGITSALISDLVWEC